MAGKHKRAVRSSRAHERVRREQTGPKREGRVQLERVDASRWRLPREQRADMRVDGLVYASDQLMSTLRDDPALEQVVNVATLPGIVGASLAMPDVHWGYGFPIGGVAAVGLDDGVVSPGGIGFDINCGVRLVRSDLTADAIGPLLDRLTEALFAAVPSGVGASAGRPLTADELDEVLLDGARWAVNHGHGWPEDLERIEEGGRLPSDSASVSARARKRGAGQLGTLGSGNHFLELDRVERIFEPLSAAAMGLFESQVVVFVHCGSRGLGHQVCTDHVAVMDRVMARYGIDVPDRQLACAPLDSPEGRAYLDAMAAASNFAWANRQAITQAVRDAVAGVLGRSARALGLDLVYDVSHNIAKVERHEVEGRETTVLVHRKGATRAFPPGHPDVPAVYREVGQPVFVPGDMGRYSFVAVGARDSMRAAFGSTCHGAGRELSRHAALRELRGVDITRQLAGEGIVVRAERPGLLAEEASIAYKDVAEVVRVAEEAGMIRRVARLRPIIVVKG
ncbi:MAG: RtcB family protein [Chloroflexota bacterium]|jgi:tRNA-splicing ligase RtcB